MHLTLWLIFFNDLDFFHREEHTICNDLNTNDWSKSDSATALIKMNLVLQLHQALLVNQKLFPAQQQPYWFFFCDLPALTGNNPIPKVSLMHWHYQYKYVLFHPAWETREGWRNTQFYLQAIQDVGRPMANHARDNFHTHTHKNTQCKTPHTHTQIYESITGTRARVCRFVTSVALPLKVPETARETRISWHCVYCLLLCTIALVPLPPNTSLIDKLIEFVW